MQPKSKFFVLAFVFSVAIGSFAIARQAVEIPERPATEQLLPETTVAMIQIPNFREALEKSKNSVAGQFFLDEDVAPLVDGVWQETELAYEDVQEKVGLELSDLTSLPNGEMSFAVIAPRRKSPEFFLLLELTEDEATLDRVLDRGREVAEANDRDWEEETTVDGFVIKAFTLRGGRRFYFLRHQNVIIGCTSTDELGFFIDRWMGREVPKVRPLAANRRYVTIMNHCQGTQDLDPEFKFFVDPIALAKSSFRGNTSAQFAIGMLPLLGLDNLSAIGGTYFLDEEDYDSVGHTHILLAKPRTGIFSLLAFKPTDYQPDPFIPADTANFAMVSIAPGKAYAELAKIIDLINGEDTFKKQVEESFNDTVRMNLKEDLIDALDGRFTWFQRVEKPIIFQSNVMAVALKLKEPEQFEIFLERLHSQINNVVYDDESTSQSGEIQDSSELLPEDPEEGLSAKQNYKGIAIYGKTKASIQRNAELRNRLRRRNNRRPGETRALVEIGYDPPSLAIVGDSLVIAFNSRKLMEKIIDTYHGESPNLADNEEYARMIEESRKLLDNELPIGNVYSDPSYFFEWVFDLYRSKNTQAALGRGAQSNKYLDRLKRRVDENPLPDFAKLKKYFAISGGVITDDDTGIHLLQFVLKSDTETE